jgi:hypothetical protein
VTLLQETNVRPTSVLLCGLLLLAGCLSKPDEVTGVVSYQDRPLPSGTITIVSADGKEYFSAIGTNGRYSVLGVPAGPVKIAVKSHASIPPGLNPGEKQQAVQIPARYANAEDSGLRATVRGGKFEHNVKLEP